MLLSKEQKQELKDQIVASLISDSNIMKIVIFGSFLESAAPKSINVAIFQESTEGYFQLSIKYQKKVKALARKIQINTFPIRNIIEEATVLSEMEVLEVVFER
jgi:hypothetical protein